MPHLDQQKNDFYQRLVTTHDLQSVAEMLSVHFSENAIAKNVQCLWQLSMQSHNPLGQQTFPRIPVADIAKLHVEARHDLFECFTHPVYLAELNNSYFIIDLGVVDQQDESNTGHLLDLLTFCAAHIKFLIAKSQADHQQVQLEQSQNLQQALFNISNLVYTENDTLVLFKKLHEIIASLVYAENFFIVRFNEHVQSLHFLYYADSIDKEPVDPEIEWSSEQMAGSIALAMLRSKLPAWGSSNQLILKFGLDPSKGLGPDSEDWLGLPMIEDGKVVGGIVLQSYLNEKRYSQADLNLLSFVAEHIRQSLTRREQTEELEDKVSERTAKLSQEITERLRAETIQSALFNITRLASQIDDIEQFYPAMHEIVGQLLEANNIYIAFINEKQKRLEFPYRVDEQGDISKSRPLSNGLTEWVLASKAPVLLNETQIIKLKEQDLAIVKGHVPKCWLGVPLIIKDKAVGVIALQSYDNVEAYSYKEQELLMFVSSHIAQALEKIDASNRLKQAYSEMESNVLTRTHELELSNQALREQMLRREEAEQKLKFEAQHDQLTGLANRTQLYARLRQSLAQYQEKPNRLFAVFFIDLDRFKVINDSMGHWVGDELLKVVAERIQRCVRKPDLVARLGGDEFAVVLNSIRNINEARLVAERMLQVFEEPIYIHGKELFASPSIGIAISQERHHEPDEILRDSDIALYRSKEMGRNRFTFFDDALHESALNTLIIEGDLRRALIRNELFPFYQPIYELKSGKVQGFEALMRWRHPQRGILIPKDFSEIAKETGLIEQVDWAIYEQVCRDIPVLLGAGDYVSINVSPRHLGQENFANRLLALIKEYGVAPNNLNIEVTEDALIEHPELGFKLLTQLNQAGIQINLDDFGTGYSSFSYLHKYPLDRLKIDRSFIATLNDSPGNKTMHLIQAIHTLGLSLGLTVVAEGVETEAQSAALVKIGIMLGQGHLFAEPASIEDLSKLFSLTSV